MTYQEALDYIQSDKWFGAKPGLERTQELLKKLGNPEKNLKFVHVAGTNGKGSTCSCIASVLRKAGYKTGLYTSPYIIRFNERMQIDGEYIEDDELARYTEEIKPLIESMEDSPTEFEVITGLAMKYFSDHRCDIVVLEVGMGGEFDSTNVIDPPECAVITAIGLDHTKELGDTLAKVASAKAGIIKDGCDVVIYGGEKEVEDVIEETCKRKNAKLFRADRSRLNIKGFDLDAAHFEFAPYGELSLPLIGTYQPYNAAVAVTAVERLIARGYNISAQNIVEGLRDVYWPGRFEVLRRDPVFILDGAHNPHGIEATAKSLMSYFGENSITFVIGVMADKDVKNMMKFIAPLAKRFVTVKPNYYRAMDENVLAGILRQYGKPVIPSETMLGGVKYAIDVEGKKGVVCALGSLYFSGDIRNAVAEFTK